MSMKTIFGSFVIAGSAFVGNVSADWAYHEDANTAATSSGSSNMPALPDAYTFTVVLNDFHVRNLMEIQ